MAEQGSANLASTFTTGEFNPTKEHCFPLFAAEVWVGVRTALRRRCRCVKRPQRARPDCQTSGWEAPVRRRDPQKQAARQRCGGCGTQASRLRASCPVPWMTTGPSQTRAERFIWARYTSLRCVGRPSQPASPRAPAPQRLRLPLPHGFLCCQS